jgi:hypothetical protein
MSIVNLFINYDPFAKLLMLETFTSVKVSTLKI